MQVINYASMQEFKYTVIFKCPNRLAFMDAIVFEDVSMHFKLVRVKVF